MSYPNKWFVDTMRGAPELRKTEGAVIAWLDACLIDGFNVQALDSLTYDSGEQAIIGENANGHGFIKYQIVEISGADQSEYNGEFLVKEAQQNLFKLVPNSPAPSTGTATGTIQAKAAPVGGWEKLNANAENTFAQYRSTEPDATGCVMQVDDTNTAPEWDNNSASAIVSLFESVLEDGTGVNEWTHPEDTQIRKAYNTGSTYDYPIQWYLVGDHKLFYFGTNPYGAYDIRYGRTPTLTSGNAMSSMCFGDVITYRPEDVFNCVAKLGAYSTSNIYPPSSFFCGEFSFHYRTISPRRYDQVLRDGYNPLRVQGSSITPYWGYEGLPYPNGADNGLYFHYPTLVYDNGAIRGKMPGLLQPLHEGMSFGWYNVFDDVQGFEGTPLLALGICARSAENTPGYLVFPLTESWR